MQQQCIYLILIQNLGDRVTAVLAEYKQGVDKYNMQITDNIDGGGGKELLADVAKPYLQQQLARIQMSDKLAERLNMSGWAKATQTLWNGFVNAFKDSLREIGLKIPGKDDASKFTLLDGMLRLTDEAFTKRSKLASTDFAKMYRAMGDIAKV